MKKARRKNSHAVALGRLGGLVRSEAKKRASKENGRKGGLVKSRKKDPRAAAQCPAAASGAPQAALNAVISVICARYCALAIGRGAGGIRYRDSQ